MSISCSSDPYTVRQLASLIVIDAHRCVMHDGVKETLAELRSAYWEGESLSEN